MNRPAHLVLQDGTIFSGSSFGAETTTYGEIVFDTAMTGYQEMLTDPSFAGQILVPTYPLIGNYGINDDDVESGRIQIRGLVIREYCDQPSHWKSIKTLHKYLEENGIPGLHSVDTRALTRHIRNRGVMMGIMTAELSREEAVKRLGEMPKYDEADFVKMVCTKSTFAWSGSPEAAFCPASEMPGRPERQYRIAVVDFGLKLNILRLLARVGCSVTVVPCGASASEILGLKPDGVLFTPGPGNPALLDYGQQMIKDLLGKKPIMGICLGLQLIGLALGGNTFKLKFGHRGGNHPVRDLKTGRVYITSQNHGFAVDADCLPRGLEVSHVNLNDGTVEGLIHRDYPVFAIQYHAEASPGPLDSVYQFHRFIDLIKSSGEPCLS